VLINVDLSDAQTHFSDLLLAVEAGEQVTITNHGRPVARLVSVVEHEGVRDWQVFWDRVDGRRVALANAATIKAGVESGRL